jgi:hypothetical protein
MKPSPLRGPEWKASSAAANPGRAYAFDLLNLLRCVAQALRLGGVEPTDLFDYLDWHGPVRR